MNKRITNNSYYKMILLGCWILILSVLWTCKSNKVGIVEPQPEIYRPGVSSRVVDFLTNEPINNAIVRLENKIVNTNSAGEFVLDAELEPGQYVLFSEAENYAYTPILVTIDSYATLMNSIFMKKNGNRKYVHYDTVTIHDNLGENRNFIVSFDENSFDNETLIIITPMEGPEAGSFFDEQIPLAVLDIEAIPPTAPQRNYQITFPLPCKFIPGVELILFRSTKYSPINQLTSFKPIVQQDSISAIVELNEIGRFTLSMEADITFSDDNISKSDSSESEVNESIVRVPLEADATTISNISLEPPDLLPEYYLSLLERSFGYKFDKPNVITYFLNTTMVSDILPKPAKTLCFGGLCSNDKIDLGKPECPGPGYIYSSKDEIREVSCYSNGESEIWVDVNAPPPFPSGGAGATQSYELKTTKITLVRVWTCVHVSQIGSNN